MDIQAKLRRVDQVQQSHRWLAFPFAVVKKFGDDRAGYLAALIAYYGFFSLFPLLLVFVSVLGFVLHGNPALRQTILDSALAQFPVLGDQLRGQIGSLRSGAAIGIGTVTALWAGLGVTQAAQNAMNEVWNVPMRERPNFLISRLRGLLALIVLGTITVAAILASGFVTARGELGALVRILGFVVSLVLNLALFLLSYRVLTRRKLSWGDVFPGAAFSAVAWTALQTAGTFYVSHQVKNATPVYGTFALVIGLLVWIYLGAQITLYGAEINAVRKLRLWPRSLVVPPPGEADRRAYRHQAEAEERVAGQEVTVTFDEPGARLDGDRSPARRHREGGAGGSFVRSAGIGAVGAFLVGWIARRRSKQRHSS